MNSQLNSKSEFCTRHWTKTPKRCFANKFFSTNCRPMSNYEKIETTINNNFWDSVIARKFREHDELSLWRLYRVLLSAPSLKELALQLYESVSFSLPPFSHNFSISSLLDSFKFFSDFSIQCAFDRSIYRSLLTAIQLNSAADPARLAISMLSSKHVFSLCNILYNIHLTAWFEGTRTSRSRPSNAGEKKKKKTSRILFCTRAGHSACWIEHSPW